MSAPLGGIVLAALVVVAAPAAATVRPKPVMLPRVAPRVAAAPVAGGEHPTVEDLQISYPTEPLLLGAWFPIAISGALPTGAMLEVGELPDGVRVRPAAPLDPSVEGGPAGLGLVASVTRVGAMSIEGLSVVAGETRIELPPIPVEIVLDVPDGHRPVVGEYLEPVAVPFPPADIWPFVGLLTLLFVGLLTYIVRTSRTIEPITTPPSPDRVATEALARLRGRLPRAPEDIPPFVDEVSDVLRVYIERRFAVHAPEQTSEEFIGAVRSHPALVGRRDALEPFLVLCDLVKFARHTPGLDQVNDLLVTAETFVEETRGHEVPAEELVAPAVDRMGEAPVADNSDHPERPA